ncbi:hypothetical protein [Actinoallomurus iriomotensis]|uniref:hypothetical protein n=1 Tax=Actinoallomurus iriomotensis TaxID=478107 RepID=UPI002556961C|nr:hypothetical protein [Actinoallomurus iriomotensis]
MRDRGVRRQGGRHRLRRGPGSRRRAAGTGDGDAPRGHGHDGAFVYAHGRIPPRRPDGTLHRYEMATGARLDAPIPAPRGTSHGARTGRPHGRDVLLVLAGTGILVYDAGTGVRLLRPATHCVTFDVTTAGEDVAITEHGARDYRVASGCGARTAEGRNRYLEGAILMA